MTCQFKDEPPDTSPCYCTATHGAKYPKATETGGYFIMRIKVCEHHAGVLRDQGAETWPLGE